MRNIAKHVLVQGEKKEEDSEATKNMGKRKRRLFFKEKYLLRRNETK